MSQSSPQTLFLVEDDLELAKMIEDFLTSESYQVQHTDNGLHAVEQISAAQPDLVILDIMLPGLDGVEVCRQIRANGFTNPVLMLTAKDDDFTEVSSLNTGADNYLNKPVRPHILLAHIKALLRRNQAPSKKQGEALTEVQDLSINLEAYQLFKGDTEIQLTSGEFQLLALLAKNAGEPISRDSLYQQLRGIEYDGIDRSIDLRISSLRKKLGDDLPPYRYIKTVRSKGYLLVVK
jgi:DNA-binding response OmpR family regulator